MLQHRKPGHRITTATQQDRGLHDRLNFTERHPAKSNTFSRLKKKNKNNNKTTQKLATEGNFLNMINDTYEKHTAHLRLRGEQDQEQDRCPFPTAHCGPSRATAERSKRHLNWGRRRETASVAEATTPGAETPPGGGEGRDRGHLAARPSTWKNQAALGEVKPAPGCREPLSQSCR